MHLTRTEAGQRGGLKKVGDHRPVTLIRVLADVYSLGEQLVPCVIRVLHLAARSASAIDGNELL